MSQAEKSDVYIRQHDPMEPYAHSRSQVEMDQPDRTLTELESRIQQMNSSQESLNRRYYELNELRHVLRETAVFFQVVSHSHTNYLFLLHNTSLFYSIRFIFHIAIPLTLFILYLVLIFIILCLTFYIRLKLEQMN